MLHSVQQYLDLPRLAENQPINGCGRRPIDEVSPLLLLAALAAAASLESKGLTAGLERPRRPLGSAWRHLGDEEVVGEVGGAEGGDGAEEVVVVARVQAAGAPTKEGVLQGQRVSRI